MKTHEINPADLLARREAGESMRAIATLYGVSPTTIQRLVNRALDDQIAGALGEQPADGDESVFAFGITGSTQSEIKESYNKAVSRAKSDNDGRVPVHVSKAIKAANEAALAAIAPPATSKRTSSAKGSVRSKTGVLRTKIDDKALERYIAKKLKEGVTVCQRIVNSMRDDGIACSMKRALPVFERLLDERSAA